MKTIVIQLDAHDDLISVRDKMDWSKAQRILLVWPPDGRPDLARKYDLVSLQRHATALGAQLGLVTRDREVNAYARELGLAVFRSAKQAQRQRWQRTHVRRRFRRRAQNPDRVNELHDALDQSKPPTFLLGWSRLAIFAMGVLAVLVMSVYLLPGATVQLQPVQTKQSIAMTVTADAKLKGASLNGLVAAETVATLVEVQGQIASTGKTSIPSGKARGTIMLTNMTNRNLTIPAGSLVSTLAPDELRFSTTREVILPSGVGETVQAPVEALVGGTVGNVAAGSVKALEGSQGPDVVVSQPEALRGGSDQTLPAITQADYAKLRNQLLETLKANAKNDLEVSLGSAKTLLADSLVLVQVEEEDALPAVGNPGDTLTLSLRAEFSALAVASQDLENLARTALDAALPKGQRALPASLEITPSTKMKTLADGRVQWGMTATRKVVPDLPEQGLLKA
ncbi:hypothetical protein FDZ74_05185, partial [bacterium]